MRTSIALLILISVSVASAQQYKYKELVVLLQDAAPQEQVAMLWDYLKYDQTEPNADFRLAKLHYAKFRQSDPLVQYHTAMANANEALARLNKAKPVVTESEVRRNNEYYAPLFKTLDAKGRPFVEFALIQKSMQDSFDSVSKFKTHMPAIYTAFTNSVNQYGQAVKIFSRLNNEYKSLEDMLLLFDDNLENELKALKNTYDSSIIYFDQYLALTNAYSIREKQKYHIKPIQVYHLDGLTTRLNFLTADVEFWNYSAWVGDVYKVYNEVIVPLKSKLEQNELKITKRLTELETQEVTPTDVVIIDKDLFFNMNIYDKNSIVLDLLRYKAYSQHWLLKKKSIDRDTTIEKKLELYSKLIQHSQSADSLHLRTKQNIKPTNLRKHSAFIGKHYGGEKGLNDYIIKEENLISTSFNLYRNELKRSLITYSRPKSDTTLTIKIGTLSIPLFVSPKTINQSLATLPVTLKQTKNPDGSMYLAGVHRMNKKTPNLKVFVTRINADGKPGWFKEYSFTPDSLATTYENYLGDIVATQEGCGVVITGYLKGTEKIANTFVFLNEKGEEKVFKIKEARIARRLLYQERSNTFIMVFKGSSEDQTIEPEETASIVSVNILGDVNWRREINFAGTVEDIISVQDGYILAGNYTSMKDANGKQLKTKVVSGQANPYLIKLNLKGDIAGTLPITSPKSIYITSVVKVNDESINLLGYEGDFSANGKLPEEGVLHMMSDYKLNTICTDF